ncbi:MAG: aldo/keto reductase [Pirellulaceae bacterium]|jgi:aryl-alcohol dehydrogenase-like predicted oxidoreductase|nr:aldo/keto reductase [Pirellulaceae bacterium]
MEYRTIAGTDLSVSLLGFGNFVFGSNWWGQFTDEDGVRLQNHAVDQGVSFFDTAPAYGNGRAERLLAETIRYAGRQNVVVSTKFGYDLAASADQGGGHREHRQDLRGAAMRKELEQSLDRLEIDCIDLYQAHNLKLSQFQDELFETLEQLQEAGKIRYWGVALGPAIGWREEGYKSFLNHDASTVQTVFNLYEQDPGREFCRICVKRRSGGVISRVPTNSGILDEEFSSCDHKFPEWDHRKFRDKNWLVYGLEKNKILRPMAAAHGCSIQQLSFKWLAAQEGLVSIEPNLLSTDQVRAFCAAADGVSLDAQTAARITELYDRDFDLGEDAHPCDWKSSITESGTIRSGYHEPFVEAER